MKTIPFRLLPLILLVILLLSACGGATADTLAGTSWKLASYGPLTSQNMAVQDAKTSLAFDTQGRLSGSAGCNGFSGDYKASDGQITTGQIMSTLMACSDPLMTQESAVLGALNGTLKYQIQQDTLSIYSADGQTLLIFTRQ